MISKAVGLLLSFLLPAGLLCGASREPVQAKNGMVVSANEMASRVGVEILNGAGNAVGEFSQVDLETGRVFQDVTGLHFNGATPDDWATRQIYGATVSRLQNLDQAAVTRATALGSPHVPTIDELRPLRQMVFRVEGDDAALVRAVETQVDIGRENRAAGLDPRGQPVRDGARAAADLEALPSGAHSDLVQNGEGPWIADLAQDSQSPLLEIGRVGVVGNLVGAGFARSVPNRVAHTPCGMVAV